MWAILETNRNEKTRVISLHTKLPNARNNFLKVLNGYKSHLKHFENSDRVRIFEEYQGYLYTSKHYIKTLEIIKLDDSEVKPSYDDVMQELKVKNDKRTKGLPILKGVKID